MFKVVIKRVVFAKTVNVIIKVCKRISNFIWFCVAFPGCITDFRIDSRRSWTSLLNESPKKSQVKFSGFVYFAIDRLNKDLIFLIVNISECTFGAFIITVGIVLHASWSAFLYPFSTHGSFCCMEFFNSFCPARLCIWVNPR